MDVLLRQVIGETVRDIEIAGDVISIGSAPDQQIQLLGSHVLGRHAVLKPSAGGVRIECRRGAAVQVDGELKRSVVVPEGGSFQIGGHRLTVIPAPAGFDLALEMIPDPDVTSSAYEAAFVTDLEKTWLSRRVPSWLLLVLILIATLVAPLVFLELSDEEEVGAGVLPTDVIWTSGPLHPAHTLAIGDDCGACHTRLFQRVQDAECRNCHESIADHIPAHSLTGNEFPSHRCATCHREHNEPEMLVMTADGQCTECHEQAVTADIPAVRGFSETDHPPFEARLLVSIATPAGTGLAFSWEPRVEPVAQAQEGSNLIFPHDVHLDEVKVRDPNDNQALGCSDCHQLAEDGEHFLPVTMDTHCADCHELTFDVSAPDRQLPHGQPREVVYAIEGFYASRYLNPDESTAVPTRRRRPDRQTEQSRCTDSPAACARAATEREVTNQFTVRGCVTCHTVSESESSDLYSRFQVHPVRLVADYYHNARFDHVSHLVQEGVTDDQACLSCHAADTSGAAADLLMPDIDNCAQCHGDPSVSDVVVLQCTGCHTYHPRYAAPTARELGP